MNNDKPTATRKKTVAKKPQQNKKSVPKKSQKKKEKPRSESEEEECEYFQDSGEQDNSGSDYETFREKVKRRSTRAKPNVTKRIQNDSQDDEESKKTAKISPQINQNDDLNLSEEDDQ